MFQGPELVEDLKDFVITVHEMNNRLSYLEDFGVDGGGEQLLVQHIHISPHACGVLK
jgi:hypothetical protein